MAKSRRSTDWTSELHAPERSILRWIRRSKLQFVLFSTIGIASGCTAATLGSFAALGVDSSDVAWRIGLWLSVALPFVFGPVLLVTIARLVTLLHASGEEFQSLAQHDPLTAVLNRRGFKHAFADGEFTANACVLVVDINDFKHVNDAYGHDVGDQVLVELAQWLSGLAGDGSIVARLGGDEFAVIAQQSVVVDAQPTLSTNDVLVTVSIGTARLGDDLDIALRNADRDLYERKRVFRRHPVNAI